MKNEAIAYSPTLDYGNKAASSPGLDGGWWYRPLGWPTHSVTLGCAMLFLWGSRFPMHQDGHVAVLVSILGFFGLFLWWVLKPFIRAGIARKYPVLPGSLWGPWRHWLVLPLVAAFLIAAARHDWGLKAAFWLSRNAMARMAAPGAAPSLPAPAGVYTVQNIDHWGTGISFRVTDGGIAGDSAGFYYDPTGAPCPRGGEDLGGGWWAWP